MLCSRSIRRPSWAYPTNRLVIGVANRGLQASNQLTVITMQAGSPLPEELGFQALIAAGTRFSSTRITEGFAGAFEPRAGTSDIGTRVLIRLARVSCASSRLRARPDHWVKWPSTDRRR